MLGTVHYPWPAANGLAVNLNELEALAVAGEAGVSQALEQLRSEVALAMALCGRRQVADIDAALIAAQPGRPVTGEGGWP